MYLTKDDLRGKLYVLLVQRKCRMSQRTNYLESASRAAPEMIDSRLSSRVFLFLASLYVKGLMISDASKSSRAAANSPGPSKLDWPPSGWLPLATSEIVFTASQTWKVKICVFKQVFLTFFSHSKNIIASSLQTTKKWGEILLCLSSFDKFWREREREGGGREKERKKRSKAIWFHFYFFFYFALNCERMSRRWQAK